MEPEKGATDTTNVTAKTDPLSTNVNGHETQSSSSMALETSKPVRSPSPMTTNGSDENTPVTKASKYECIGCKTKCTSKHTLQMHYTKCEQVKLTWPCKLKRCGKVFHSIDNYSRHKRDHQYNPYSCSKCGKRFSTLMGVRQHRLCKRKK